ncbi:hypothetical protein [Paraburkholderia xenovorans]
MSDIDQPRSERRHPTKMNALDEILASLERFCVRVRKAAAGAS